MALSKGQRGLRGGSSLAKLPSVKRRVRNHMSPANLSLRKILAWADDQRQRTGNWPTSETGGAAAAPGDQPRPPAEQPLYEGTPFDFTADTQYQGAVAAAEHVYNEALKVRMQAQRLSPVRALFASSARRFRIAHSIHLQVQW
jgi:hypothetical protein